ncbi:hypothetical protein C1651_22025 [Klebsiella pneumoniae]|uniref:hypothetical protein n=1 Tax=Klebsiella pneumoniae TaxID=573 RepID=UPI000CD5A959|nr:hypothetical protein [Klebsiella pneumoniae]POK24114.1 hypothetical protein C1651_22025 [Klebsiella pneumoniae]
MDEEQKIYLETLKELNTRSISTRRITITFIYILLLATALVLTGIFAIKSKNNNPITNFISSMIDGNNELYQATTILNNYTKALEAFFNTKTQNLHDKKNSVSDANTARNDRFKLQPDDLIYLKKDKSEKIADSIASILISFSVLLFIGYVTRIFVIFTKYYMQLSNDYENQKIAYMLSRGDISKFSSTLDALRNHNISFDKTPHPPQEKLIAGLTEAIAAQTKSKFKNEN